MVGIVVVSHSPKLGEAVVELAAVMAPEAPIKAAGGTDSGGFGISEKKITEAIDAVYSDEGTVIFMDLGSAVMKTEKVLAKMPDRRIRMMNCPVLEGTVAAAVVAAGGASMVEVIKVAEATRTTSKL